MQPFRLDGESDNAFRQRATRAGEIAKIQVDACLANRRCMQELIDDPDVPMFTEEAVRRSPVVRGEYEQAIAIGALGETRGHKEQTLGRRTMASAVEAR